MSRQRSTLSRSTLSRSLLFGWALACAAMLLFAGLGRWQLSRMHQKQALLADAQGVLDARAGRPLSAAADPTRSRSYDWAAGSGRFRDAPALLLDNQQRNGRPGVRAYRVFEPDVSVPEAIATPLLVELGWLPLPGDRQLPAIAAIHGIQRVEGLLAPPPSTGLATPTATPQPDGTLLMTALDPALLARTLGLPALAPRVLRLDPAAPLGYARDLALLPNTLPPEKHLGYAVQWFALALAVLVTALLLTFRRATR